MRKYVWPVPSDSDSESTNLPGVERPLYHVPGGLLIPVRRRVVLRVVRTKVPRSSRTAASASSAAHAAASASSAAASAAASAASPAPATDSTKRRRVRPRRFNPETGGEYSPLR